MVGGEHEVMDEEGAAALEDGRAKALLGHPEKHADVGDGQPFNHKVHAHVHETGDLVPGFWIWVCGFVGAGG